MTGLWSVLQLYFHTFSWKKIRPGEKTFKHSTVSFAGELTHTAYKDVSVLCLFCEDVLCIPPKIQKAGIEMIEKESGRKVSVTSMKADHCPIITTAQEVVYWISDVAGKWVEPGSSLG